MSKRFNNLAQSWVVGTTTTRKCLGSLSLVITRLNDPRHFLVVVVPTTQDCARLLNLLLIFASIGVWLECQTHTNSFLIVARQKQISRDCDWVPGFSAKQ